MTEPMELLWLDNVEKGHLRRERELLAASFRAILEEKHPEVAESK